MANKLTLNKLKDAVTGHAAAFRCRRRLQPAGGPGDKVFPPTYAGAVYHIEQRRLPGREQSVTCVVLDSVQSQANRIEEALQQAVEDGCIKLPLIVVDFGGASLIEEVGRITSLQVPHRAADAILRDSVTKDGKLFRDSEVGKSITLAKVRNATPLFQHCPTALLLGMWDSTGPKGGLGEKFERAMVSEVVGIDAVIDERPQHMGIRRDPLSIRAAVKVKKQNGSWQVAKDPKAKGTLSPSEVNHSSVPFSANNGGVTIDYAEQVTTLSLAVLRRLRFPISDKAKPEAEAAARTVLAALGLCGATLAFGHGQALRSRCLLWPEGPMQWELLAVPGQKPESFELDADAAQSLLAEAASLASKLGVGWSEEPVELKPSKQLAELVSQSQQLAVAEGGEE